MTARCGYYGRCPGAKEVRDTGPGKQLSARMMGRYQRQMVLPEVGLAGQERLLSSSVLIVGAGALGSAAATYLTMAGVGTVGIVDGDVVDLSNLHRQILHDEAHVGMRKTESAAIRLRALNPDVRLNLHSEYVSSGNVRDIFSSYDVIINGSDNFPTRYLVNDAAVLLKKPLVDAAILRFEGQLSVFLPGAGCYRCLFPTPPPPGAVPDCAEAGVFGALAGVMGSMQALEALKLLLHLTEPKASTFLIYDALKTTWQRFSFPRNEDCVVCGNHPTVTELIDYEDFCGIAGPSASAPPQSPAADLSVEGALSVSDTLRLLEEPNVRVVDVRSEQEYRAGHIPGALHCPLEDLDTLKDPDSRLIIVCAVGVRSTTAAQYLRSKGRDAWSLTGGMARWRAAENPLESSPEDQS